MKKLYVVTRRDLRPSQQAVQAVHAAVLETEGMVGRPSSSDWPKGIGPTVILYGVCCVHHLRHLRDKMEGQGEAMSAFCEPDLGELTAIACYGEKPQLFKGLQLL